MGDNPSNYSYAYESNWQSPIPLAQSDIDKKISYELSSDIGIFTFEIRKEFLTGNFFSKLRKYNYLDFSSCTETVKKYYTNTTPGKLDRIDLSLYNYQLILPDDFFIKITDDVLSYENNQVYVHCDNIVLSRISNQNENIYQDFYIANENIKNERITDYVSLPMYTPIKLNTNFLGKIHFDCLNSVGELNNYISLEDNTVIVSAVKNE